MLTVYITDKYGRKEEYGYVKDNEVYKSHSGLWFDKSLGSFKVYDGYAEVFVGVKYILKDVDAKIYPNGAMYIPTRYLLDDEVRIGRIYKNGDIYLGKSQENATLGASLELGEYDDIYEACAAFCYCFIFNNICDWVDFMDKDNILEKYTEFLKVVTRGWTANGKPRVYFACHPDDFNKYFKKVCKDIFKTQDCAIYYTKSMSKSIPDLYSEIGLGRMNLFVIPITYKLLAEKNRAMDFDFKYATDKNVSIPILPIMMESGIDSLYVEKFGNRQYFCPLTKDFTAISYEEKLKKYLSSVLLDDGTIERIRKAFDAYIFLSYRKKDRNHANELMKLIHKIPRYRDIAIWYDEFLTPGENFNENIEKALDNSKLFTLLVTPNLVNEENYVQSIEYPLAQKNKKKILPTEVVDTDKKLLSELYPNIPECINGNNKIELDKGIYEALKTVSLQTNDTDAEHLYLIGLAYLEGIDVEINVEYAIELIERAAKNDYPEAMEKLLNMYCNGDHVCVDYNEIFKCANKLYNFYLSTKGESNYDTILTLICLSTSYAALNDFDRAIECSEKAYEITNKIYGEKDPKTIYSLNSLAMAYNLSGNHAKAVDLARYSYKQNKDKNCLNDDTAIFTLYLLLIVNAQQGRYKRASFYGEKSYVLSKKVYGKNHDRTMHILTQLAYVYYVSLDFKKAAEYFNIAYKFNRKKYGKNSPETTLLFEYLSECTLHEFIEFLSKDNKK